MKVKEILHSSYEDRIFNFCRKGNPIDTQQFHLNMVNSFRVQSTFVVFRKSLFQCINRHLKCWIGTATLLLRSTQRNIPSVNNSHKLIKCTYHKGLKQRKLWHQVRDRNNDEIVIGEPLKYFSQKIYGSERNQKYRVQVFQIIIFYISLIIM